jgi:uncharacterized membrane protein YhaH (DUF805 family)
MAHDRNSDWLKSIVDRAWQLYLSPRGRISRRTYWISLLVLLFAFSGLFVVIEELLQTRFNQYCLLLIVAWPMIVVSIKRWHDRDKSGWWLLIALVPIVGIWNLVECGFLPGTPGMNRFGQNPKDLTDSRHHKRATPSTPP